MSRRCGKIKPPVQALLKPATSDIGTGFTFTNHDGAGPTAGLILSGNTLYGAAVRGGSVSLGTIFALQTDGTGFRVVHDFGVTPDGNYPGPDLILYNNL